MLWFNAAFVEQQDTNRLCGLVAHELLHAALLHGLRRRERDPVLWNIAADIVVNGMIRKDTTYGLPLGGVEDARWHTSASRRSTSSSTRARNPRQASRCWT